MVERCTNPTPWHREMRGEVVEAGLELNEQTDGVLALCSAEIERLKAERDQYLKSSVDYGNLSERLRARIESARVLVEEYDRVASIDHVAAKAILWRLTDEQSVPPEKDPDLMECPACGGSGFSTPGTGYGDVCGECGGMKYVRL